MKTVWKVTKHFFDGQKIIKEGVILKEVDEAFANCVEEVPEPLPEPKAEPELEPNVNLTIEDKQRMRGQLIRDRLKARKKS